MTGILKISGTQDKLPSNSHGAANMLLLENWKGLYLQL